MKPRILLTGFNAPVFIHINPSERLMNAIAQMPGMFQGALVRTAVLDPDFRGCLRQFRKIVQEYQPHAVLSFGVDCNRDQVCIERLAINIDYDKTPDNSGVVRSGLRVVKDGPVGYWATVPVERIAGALQKGGIRAEISGYAGGFLCNHLFYYGLHLAEHIEHRFQMGFIHVPPFPDQLQTRWKARKGMSLEELCKAARQIVKAVAAPLTRRTARQTHPR